MAFISQSDQMVIKGTPTAQLAYILIARGNQHAFLQHAIKVARTASSDTSSASKVSVGSSRCALSSLGSNQLAFCTLPEAGSIQTASPTPQASTPPPRSFRRSRRPVAAARSHSLLRAIAPKTRRQRSTSRGESTQLWNEATNTGSGEIGEIEIECSREVAVEECGVGEIALAVVGAQILDDAAAAFRHHHAVVLLSRQPCGDLEAWLGQWMGQSRCNHGAITVQSRGTHGAITVQSRGAKGPSNAKRPSNAQRGSLT